MASTNVPPLNFTSTGFVAPSTQAIQLGVQTDMQAAFGGNLNFTTNSGSATNSTPQAELADSWTGVISDAYSTMANLFNSVDPAFATGRMQDAIGRIYFIARNPALPTVVQCTCVGVVNTVIPNGALAQDQAGNTYVCTVGGVIPAGGSITLQFTNVVAGPIQCPAGTLTKIYQAIPGWDTITNPSSGVLGQNTESASAFELRREQSVQANAVGIMGAIIGAVAQVPGVIDYFGQDNPTASPITVNGQTIAAFSMYVCVSGGTNLAVGNAILSKRPPGCAMVGNTTVTAADNNPLYVTPIFYSITFQRPTSLNIYFTVVLKNNVNIPSNALALIQAAIQTVFAGSTSSPRPRINSLIFASQFYNAIAALGTWAQIVDIQIGSINTTSAVFTASISGTNLVVTAVSSGTLAPGQYVAGANVLDGTTIISGPGGGGTGTYVISATQTVASETMNSVTPNLNSIQVQANQEPVYDTPNTTLTLV